MSLKEVPAVKDARAFMRQYFALTGGVAAAAAAAVDATSCYCIDMRAGSKFLAGEPADASGIFGIEIEFTCQGIRVPQLEVLNLCFG